MDPDTLRDRWKENNHRPQFVIDARDEIHEHTTLEKPIPTAKSEIREYLQNYRPTITRQLNAAADDGDDGGSDTNDDTQDEVDQ